MRSTTSSPTGRRSSRLPWLRAREFSGNGAREIRLRYLPKPSLNRWIAEALIDYHRVIEKIRADIAAGELT
jgi:hypothetical protein